MNKTDHFNAFLQEEASPMFSSICEMMYHTKVNEGGDFLRSMDKIAEYYTNRISQQDGIQYHFVYLPMCPEWARELLVRYFIHKFAFTYSDHLLSVARTNLAHDLILPYNATPKVIKRLRAERAYYKKFIRLFGNKSDISQEREKSLIVVQEKDILTRNEDKNPWLGNLYTTDLFDLNQKVIVSTSDTAFDIESEFRRNRGRIPKIDNIFIFHSRNRGRITSSFNMQQLERLNRYGAGIKNCFIFYISEMPFRLYDIQENIKSRLLGNLLRTDITRYNDSDRFITFTPEEVAKMFGQPYNRSTYIIDSNERDIVTSELDTYIDELPHDFKVRTLMSLSFSEDSKEIIINECEELNDPTFENIVTPVISFYKDLWDSEIKPALENALSGCEKVVFAVPYFVSPVYRRLIKDCFRSANKQVDVVDTTVLQEGVRADAIVLFTYLYTDSRYRAFPNSFDPIPSKPGQKCITIINRLTHNRYYVWNKYFYDQAFNGLLYSNFREEKLGWGKISLSRPVIPDIFEAVDEAESEARDYMAERCCIQLENSRHTVSPNDLVIYRENDKYLISSIRELRIEDNLELDLLDNVVDQVRKLFTEKSDNRLRTEDIIRKDPKYELTQSEIESDVELWKILLHRKVEASSLDSVYEAIFPTGREISKNGFARWINYDDPMIFPRSRRCQNSLLTYLGFNLGCAYHKLILTKKLTRNNDTRLLNRLLESLLRLIIPITNINQEDYDTIYESNSEILSMLDIDSAGDLNALKDLLEINLQKVISVQYD